MVRKFCGRIIACKARAALNFTRSSIFLTPQLILRKGHHAEINSYSAFFENDRTTPTGLASYLRERGFSHVFLAGLALDFCVRYSAEDAHRSGFRVTIIEDACRGIDVNGSMEDARKMLCCARHSVRVSHGRIR